MTNTTFDRWLLGACGLVALLVAAGVLTVVNTWQLNDDAGWVAHTHEVLDGLGEVSGHLREAESVQRTYLIVGGDARPPAFDENIDAARERLGQVKLLTQDNKEQQARIPDISQGIEDLADRWARTMTVRQEQGLAEARETVVSGQGARMMLDLQARLREMADTEHDLLRDRSEKRKQTYHAALVAGLLSAFAAVAGVVAFTVLLRRHLAIRSADAAALAESGERLRTTLASIGDAVITTNVEGHITGMNGVAEALTGWKLTEATGQPLETVFRIVNEQTRQPVENPAIRAIRQGVVVGLANHTILIAREGTERPIDDSAAPIRRKEGKVVGCVLVFRDVSERRRAEEENASRLRAARLLAAIVESSDDAIVSKTLEGVIQSWNASAERLFGYTAEQAVGRHISLIIPPDRLGEEAHIIASLKAGHRVDHFETVRVRSDGRSILVSLTISPIKDEEGRIIGASKIARDITRQRQAEEDRQKFVTLVESSTDFIGMCDLAGIPFYVNRAGLKLVGLDGIEQARRTSVRDFFFPEDQPEMMEKFFPSVLEKGHGEIEVRFRNFKTGEARWMAYKVLTLADASGRTVGFATVSQDVTERRQMADSLRKVAADLSEADHRKDEFLAILAHELRNPLAPIRNALQTLRLAPDRATRDQARTMMERQLGQMVRLVDDLLDVNRITRGKLELRKERVPLAEVVQSAVETSRPVIDHLGHQLTVTLRQQPIFVDADLTRLAQVFSNLLNNSAKYTDRGGRIWLTAEQQGDEVVVSVKDTGIGIAADQLPRLFEMFSQVDGALERAQGGLGIGLTLVKWLVEMHGGRVEAASAGLGQGAEFTVRLPVSKASDPRQGEEHSPAAPKSLRILIVDDNRDGADSLAMLLHILGNDSHTAYDGQQGVEMAEKVRPDVILLDIGLPKLNGYEACRRIRNQPWANKVVLIALTGWGQEEDRRRSQEAGFDYHMVKPVDPQELLRLLAELKPG
jgi:PAS domain S-box-containing protein